MFECQRVKDQGQSESTKAITNYLVLNENYNVFVVLLTAPPRQLHGISISVNIQSHMWHRTSFLCVSFLWLHFWPLLALWVTWAHFRHFSELVWYGFLPVTVLLWGEVKPRRSASSYHTHSTVCPVSSSDRAGQSSSLSTSAPSKKHLSPIYQVSWSEKSG